MGDIVLHSEAVKLLDEIAFTTPELLGFATQISIDNVRLSDCVIVIKTNMTKEQRDMLLSAFSDKKLQILEKSSGVWVIS